MAAGINDPSSWNERTRTSHVESLRLILGETDEAAGVYMDRKLRQRDTKGGNRSNSGD